MRHYLGIMMPLQESDTWSYDTFTRRLVAHMQSSDGWAQGIAKITRNAINDLDVVTCGKACRSRDSNPLLVLQRSS